MHIESTAHYLPHRVTNITERRTLLSNIENIDTNVLGLSEPPLIKTLLLAVINLMQMLWQMFSMQLLNMFYLLKHLKKCFFNEVKRFPSKVIHVYVFNICKFLFLFSWDSYFIPGYPYNFRYLVIVSFSYSIWYN